MQSSMGFKNNDSLDIESNRLDFVLGIRKSHDSNRPIDRDISLHP